MMMMMMMLFREGGVKYFCLGVPRTGWKEKKLGGKEKKR